MPLQKLLISWSETYLHKLKLRHLRKFQAANTLLMQLLKKTTSEEYAQETVEFKFVWTMVKVLTPSSWTLPALATVLVSSPKIRVKSQL